MKNTAKQTVVTPDDSGLVGVPMGLLLALTFAPDHFANVGADFDRLYVGVTGDVTLQSTNSISPAGVLFKAVPVGVLNTAGRAVLKTGTTATNMVAIKD